MYVTPVLPMCVVRTRRAGGQMNWEDVNSDSNYGNNSIVFRSAG
jgi:hypothetical protein